MTMTLPEGCRERRREVRSGLVGDMTQGRKPAVLQKAGNIGTVNM